MSGSPGLFFAFDPRRSGNSVTGTIWYDPFRVAAGWSDLYAINVRLSGRVSENRVQTIRDRDTWAVHKLWTNWHAPVDLRLEVEGGHLYRRGSFAYLSEAGAVRAPTTTQSCTQGQVEHLTLKIGTVDNFTTGYQLAITLPDKATESSLKDFYGSVLNGGAVNDQKGFDFGNETDGWYYAGSCWMYGTASRRRNSGRRATFRIPTIAAQAFREHLAHVLSTIDELQRHTSATTRAASGSMTTCTRSSGCTSTCFTVATCPCAPDACPAGTHAGLLRPTPQPARVVQARRRRAHLVLRLRSHQRHQWLLQCILLQGGDRPGRDGARDRARPAGASTANWPHRSRRHSMVYSGRRNATGGPRYVDWIDAQGKEVAYFCDLCQWPPIAVGIASPEQARKIVATADARIKQLEQEYGYPGYAGLSALWPVPAELNPPWHRSAST